VNSRLRGTPEQAEHAGRQGARLYLSRRTSPFALTPIANRTRLASFGMPWPFKRQRLAWLLFPGFPNGLARPPATPTAESKANKGVDKDMEVLSQKLRDHWNFGPDTVSNGTCTVGG